MEQNKQESNEELKAKPDEMRKGTGYKVQTIFTIEKLLLRSVWIERFAKN